MNWQRHRRSEQERQQRSDRDGQREAERRQLWAAACLGAALIAFHAVVHRDAGGWIAKGATLDTVALEGHLVEWEWIHVAATAGLLDPRVKMLEPMSTQDAFRFIPGLAVGALRAPAGSTYTAALVATLLAWGAATAAVAGVARVAWLRPTVHGERHSTFALFAGVVLMAQGAGYVAFLGNVDAHQFGYAAVALVCGAWLCFRPDERAPDHTLTWRGVATGLTLCLAGYALEIAYPLLLSSWLLLGAAAWRRDLTLGQAVLQSVVVTLAFGVPYLAFQAVMRTTLGPNLVALNDPTLQLIANLTAVRDQGPPAWLAGRLSGLAERWPAAFPLPVSALALVGLGAIPRRWLVWAILVVLPMLAALLVTKFLVRTLYLIHSPVYVLAAAGAAWLAERAGRLAPQLPWLPAAVLTALLLAVSLVTNADLWGDYHIPTWWWGIQ